MTKKEDKPSPNSVSKPVPIRTIKLKYSEKFKENSKLSFWEIIKQENLDIYKAHENAKTKNENK